MVASPVDYDSPHTPTNISIADMDGDLKPDIIVSDSTTGKVFVYRNLSVPGNINLDIPVELFSGLNAFSSSIGDLNGDGKPDIAVCNRGANSLSLLVNSSSPGTLSFAAPVSYPVGTGPEAIAIANLNGNSRQEIISVSVLNNKLSVLYWPTSCYQ
jgi:hypothetical protein